MQWAVKILEVFSANRILIEYWDPWKGWAKGKRSHWKPRWIANCATEVAKFVTGTKANHG